jgi:hypothetical protein
MMRGKKEEVERLMRENKGWGFARCAESMRARWDRGGKYLNDVGCRRKRSANVSV